MNSQQRVDAIRNQLIAKVGAAGARVFEPTIQVVDLKSGGASGAGQSTSILIDRAFVDANTDEKLAEVIGHEMLHAFVSKNPPRPAQGLVVYGPAL